MLICDNVRKDRVSHTYQWIMQLPTDVEEVMNTGNEVVLRETNGDRRLLLRFLQEGSCTTKIELYEARTHTKTGEIANGKRLVATMNAVDAAFRVMLYPFHEGGPLPTTKWSPDHSSLRVSFSDRADVLAFSTEQGAATKVTLTRYPTAWPRCPE
jgi:hypothetical protein